MPSLVDKIDSFISELNTLSSLPNPTESQRLALSMRIRGFVQGAFDYKKIEDYKELVVRKVYKRDSSEEATRKMIKNMGLFLKMIKEETETRELVESTKHTAIGTSNRPEKKFDFFICHAFENYDIAKGIKLALEELDKTAHIAHTKIPIGNDWHKEIQDRILESENILILATSTLNSRSQYCHYEIGFAEQVGLTKHIFFLDSEDFPAYISPQRVQGYPFRESNCQDKLDEFFKKTSSGNKQPASLAELSRAIKNYVNRLSIEEDLIEKIKTVGGYDQISEFSELTELDKLTAITNLLGEIRAQRNFEDYSSKIPSFLHRMLSYEKSPEFREKAIKRLFGFLTHTNSYGAKKLFFELCNYRFNREELDLLKRDYLDYIITAFSNATNFNEANTASNIIGAFKGTYLKDQLKELYASLLKNRQIHDGHNARLEIIEVLKAQRDIVPEIMGELSVLEENDFKFNKATREIFIPELKERDPLILEYRSEAPFRKYPINRTQIWERVGLTNKGREVAKNATIRLMEIQKKDEQGRWELLNYHDSATLWWSGTAINDAGMPQRDFNPRDVLPGDRAFVDVVFDDITGNKLWLCIDQTPRGCIQYLESGNYLLKLNSYSEVSPPKEHTLAVDYNSTKTNAEERLKVTNFNQK